jgi:2-polyprenyl-3-methyl-5-hydroxy-6-metoxy-1,4-benzoquinol methylase
MALGTKLRGRLNKFFAKPEFDPARYWNERHIRHKDALSGPGCLGLTEAENAHDYAVKSEAIISSITANFGDISKLTVLDTGCGTGFFAEILVNAGATVTGVDFSAAAIDSARSRVKTAQFEIAQLESLSFHKQYDVVLSIDVLYHIIDDSMWESAVAGMIRACKTGGGVLIQEALDLQDVGEHVRWRSFSDYATIAAACDSSIQIVKQYQQPAEPVVKTILLIKPAAD